MAFCVNCGQRLSDSANFCSNCGKCVNCDSTHQRKTVYEGEIHQCPNCGEVLNSFVVNCPTCGYEIRGMQSNSTVIELAKKIEKASSTDEKNDLITNFYVPNTKEDIFDFFILAVSNLEDTVYDTDDAWRAKLEQTYHKARISFGKTLEFDYIDKLYNRTRSKVSKRWIFNFVRKNEKLCISVLLVSIGIVFLIIGAVLMSNDETACLLFISFSILFILSPKMLYKSKENEKKDNTVKKEQNNAIIVGKDSDDFYLQQYEDVVEQFRELGFKNIVVKAERKGLHSEGEVKCVSIAGNSEFNDNDEFNINSKVLIRYYSKNF